MACVLDALYVFDEAIPVFTHEVCNSLTLGLRNQFQVIFDTHTIIVLVPGKATDQNAATHGMVNIEGQYNHVSEWQIIDCLLHLELRDGNG